MAIVGSFELYFFWLGVTLAISSLGTAFRRYEEDRIFWERRVRTPSWAPRAPFVYGLIWMILFAVQSIGATRLRQIGAYTTGGTLTPLVLYLVLQFVNAAYTPVFFRARSFFGAVAVTFVAFLLAAILAGFAYGLDIPSGIVFTIQAIWQLYAFAISIATAINSRSEASVRSAVRRQMRRTTAV